MQKDKREPKQAEINRETIEDLSRLARELDTLSRECGKAVQRLKQEQNVEEVRPGAYVWKK